MTFRRAVTDRGEKARQKLLLVRCEGPSRFNLVAELRLLLPALLSLLALVFWATSDETVVKETLLSMGAVCVSSFSAMFSFNNATGQHDLDHSNSGNDDSHRPSRQTSDDNSNSGHIDDNAADLNQCGSGNFDNNA